MLNPEKYLTEEEKEQHKIDNIIFNVGSQIAARKRKEEEAKIVLTPVKRMFYHVLDNTLTFFKDQYGDEYIEHVGCFNNRYFIGTKQVDTEAFKLWAVDLAFTKDEDVSSHNLPASVALTIRSQCKQERDLFTRVGLHDDDIYIDMCNPYYESIKVSVNGWRICKLSPLIFRRFKDMKPLITPAPQTSIEEARENINLIFKYANIREEDRLIFLTMLVNYLIPDAPHPILVIHGIQGSAKSSIFRCVKKLVDPAVNNLTDLPNNIEDLCNHLTTQWVTFYDNVTYIDEAQSSKFCEASTDLGFKKRKLFTNNESVTYSVKCCVGLNGITQTVDKSDLLNRSIIFETEPIERRITERVFNKMFAVDAPVILSSMLTVLVEALRVFPSIIIEDVFRMADYHVFGAAIAVALGYDIEEFNRQYRLKTELQIIESFNKEPLAPVFLSFFNKHFSKLGCEDYEATYSKLLQDLNNEALTTKIDVNVRKWPQTTVALGKKIAYLKPVLMERGYWIETLVKRQDGEVGNFVKVSFKPVSNSETPTQNTVKTTVTSEAIQQQLNHNNHNNSSKPNDELLYQIYNQQQRQTETPIEPPVLQTDPKHSIFSCSEQEEINRLPQPKPSQNPLQSMSSPVYTPMTCGQCTHYHTTDCSLPDPQRSRISQGAMHCYNCPKFTQKPPFLNNQPVPSQTIVEESFEELMNKEFDQI